MSRITNHQLVHLRSLPIEGVAQRLGLCVSRHTCLCPFHEDRHPSLHFHVGRNSYKCFVCGAHGGPIDLVMNHLHKPFFEACQWLSDGTNIILEEWKPTYVQKTAEKIFDASKYDRFFEHPYLGREAVAFLFEERRISQKVVRWCRLTSYVDKQGTHWLQIPYYSIEGKLIGIQSRNLDYWKGSPLPRFRFPSGNTCHIYNLPILRTLREDDSLYLTEGASDAWSMMSSGRKAIAIPSATLLNLDDLKVFSLLKSLHITLHMYPDQDEPGDKLFRSLSRLATDAGLCLVRHDLPPGCKDYSDLYIRSS